MRLTQEQVAKVIGSDQHFPGREQDQAEVKGYDAALDEVERRAKETREGFGGDSAKVARAGDGWWQDAREGNALSGRSKRDLGRALSGHRLPAARSQRRARAHGAGGGLDQPGRWPAGADQGSHRTLSICHYSPLL